MTDDTNRPQVLGDQAVVDPSKVEELVKGQVQRRKAQHDARNQAAKLTPQEKKDKKKKKLLEDTSKELQVRRCAARCGAVVVFFVALLPVWKKYRANTLAKRVEFRS